VPLCGDQDMDFVEVSDSHILIKQFELPLKVINVCVHANRLTLVACRTSTRLANTCSLTRFMML
jgi:hypothetical protein